MQSPPSVLSTTLVGASFLYVASPGKSDLAWGETRFAITGLNPSAHAPGQGDRCQWRQRRGLNSVFMSTQ